MARARKVGDNRVTTIKFVYDGVSYHLTTVEAAKMFNVDYSMVHKNLVKYKKPAQQVIDYAAKQGGHYPRRLAIMNRILYKTGLLVQS